MIDIKTIGAKLGLTLKQASPEILTGGGLILGLAAMIVACSKMRKLRKSKKTFRRKLKLFATAKLKEPRNMFLVM